jgi:hypothetical protein
MIGPQQGIDSFCGSLILNFFVKNNRLKEKLIRKTLDD